MTEQPRGPSNGAFPEPDVVTAVDGSVVRVTRDGCVMIDGTIRSRDEVVARAMRALIRMLAP